MSDDSIFSPRAFRRGLRGAGITATEYRVAVELCEYAGPKNQLCGRPSLCWPRIANLIAAPLSEL
jgi:hypothetical protein